MVIPTPPIFYFATDLAKAVFLYGPKVCLSGHESEQTGGNRAAWHAAVYRVAKSQKGFSNGTATTESLSSGPWLKFSLDSRNAVCLFFPFRIRCNVFPRL